MKFDFCTMIANSQGLPQKILNFDNLFAQWQQNKQYFYSLFGNKLIYKTKDIITFPLTEQVKKDRINEFLDWLDENFVWSNIKNADLYELYQFISINQTDFFTNQLTNQYSTSVKIKNKRTEIIIQKGTKIIKAFKYFVEDKELLFTLQNKASLILQENKIEGRLCLSIHPLDYLTISENTLGWHSCHSLTNDYRAGNLNYMADSSTLVCYLESNKADEFFGVKWNNKKWRVLLFFSKDYNISFAAKQYPFNLSAALFKIKDMWQDLTNNDWTDWEQGLTKFSYTEFAWPHYNLGGLNGLIGLNNIIKENKYKLYYNDLLKSSTYKNPYYMIRKSNFFTDQIINSNEEDWIVNIGADVLCPICNYYVLTKHDLIICSDCQDNYKNIEPNLEYCAYCNIALPPEKLILVHDSGDYICPNCAKLYTKTCDRCGKRYPNNQIKWHQKYNKNLCDWCFYDLNEEREET